MPTRIICAAINKVDWFALGDGSVSLERPYFIPDATHTLFQAFNFAEVSEVSNFSTECTSPRHLECSGYAKFTHAIIIL